MHFVKIRDDDNHRTALKYQKIYLNCTKYAMWTQEQGHKIKIKTVVYYLRAFTQGPQTDEKLYLNSITCHSTDLNPSYTCGKSCKLLIKSCQKYLSCWVMSRNSLLLL